MEDCIQVGGAVLWLIEGGSQFIDSRDSSWGPLFGGIVVATDQRGTLRNRKEMTKRDEGLISVSSFIPVNCR